MKAFCLIIICIALSTEWKTLDLEKFTIDVQETWEYVPGQGVDSYVGAIKGEGVNLAFELSPLGHANQLMETPEEYAERMSHHYSYIFLKKGVIYTHGDVEAVRQEEIKKRKGVDPKTIRVEKTIVPTRRIYKPTDKDHEKHRLADFLVDLTHNDSTVTMVILLPENIKSHNISLDTVGNYIVKHISPKIPGKGTTGVLYTSLTSSTNFQLHGIDIPAELQEDVNRACSSIIIKVD